MDITQYIPEGITAWDLAWALISILAGWVLSRFAKRTVRSLGNRTDGISDSLTQVLAQLSQWVVVLLGLGIALSFLGARIQPVLAVVLIVGAVAVLVLRGVADNFAAGVILQTRKPVILGDQVRVEVIGEVMAGMVTEVNSRAVVLLTSDGRTVHVPNGMLLQSAIVNDSTNGARRSGIRVRVQRDGRTMAEIQSLLTDAAAQVDEVITGDSSQQPQCVVDAVAPDQLTLTLQFWHDPTSGQPSRAAVVTAIAAVIEESGLRGSVSSLPEQPALPPSEHL